jgi:hypothetical protein
MAILRFVIARIASPVTGIDRFESWPRGGGRGAVRLNDFRAIPMTGA